METTIEKPLTFVERPVFWVLGGEGGEGLGLVFLKTPALRGQESILQGRVLDSLGCVWIISQTSCILTTPNSNPLIPRPNA